MKGESFLKVPGIDEFMEVQVFFGLIAKSGQKWQPLSRLVQVSTALAEAPNGSVSQYVTKVETNFEAGCIIVTALVPESLGVEGMQRALLDLVSPA